LPHAQVAAPFMEDRLVALREFHNEVVGS
jgi:hypothetical protein